MLSLIQKKDYTQKRLQKVISMYEQGPRVQWDWILRMFDQARRMHNWIRKNSLSPEDVDGESLVTTREALKDDIYHKQLCD